jgi:hypothetical protein
VSTASARRVAVLQSNYIPWKGYFDLIGLCDAFVVYDAVQYTKNDWRNRNRVKTAAGPLWLTIPVAAGGNFGQRIDEARVTDQRWRAKHWRTIAQAYARAPHFASLEATFAELYLERDDAFLSVVNRSFIDTVCTCLGIETTIHDSSEFTLAGDATERLVQLCRELAADSYLTGPAARAYLDETAFAAAGIEVEYMSYDDYPEYPQPHPPFVHEVSVLDLLFCTGPEAPRYMKFGAARSAVGG